MRADRGLFRILRKVVWFFTAPPPLKLPAILKPLGNAAYQFHYFVIMVYNGFLTALYRYPLFASRCESVGKGLRLDRLPFVSGHTRISIGDNCYLGGNVMIISGRFLDEPRLVLKDYAEIGWNTTIVVNREVVIEEYARVSYDCRVSDSDGHPRDAERRARNQPMDPGEIRPVRICRHAWIANGCHIMKGVTIGEGAIIGANSVVISDIPPYCIAMGNPAEVYFRNINRKTRARAARPD